MSKIYEFLKECGCFYVWPVGIIPPVLFFGFSRTL